MNTNQSLQNIKDTIVGHQLQKIDYITSNSSMYMDSTSKLQFNNSIATLKNTAHTQLAQRIGIPNIYYKKLLRTNMTLLADNVNYALQEIKDHAYLLRVLNNDVRAILSVYYKRIDNISIIEQIIVALENANVKYTIVSSDISDNYLYLKIIFDNNQVDVRPGDPVNLGIIIKNSETGLAAFSIQPFVYRLICTNGMIDRGTAYDIQLKQSHCGSKVLVSERSYNKIDARLALHIQHKITHASNLDSYTSLIETMKRAVGSSKINNPDAAVTAVGKKHDLSAKHQTDVLTNLLDGNDYSQWGLVNAVTKLGNSVTSYEKASDLELLGGTILNLNPTEWQTLAAA